MSLSTAEFTLQPLSGYIKYGDSPRCGEMSRSDKGTLSRQELAVSNANRLRDYSGSLVKGAGYERSE